MKYKLNVWYKNRKDNVKFLDEIVTEAPSSREANIAALRIIRSGITIEESQIAEVRSGSESKSERKLL